MLSAANKKKGDNDGNGNYKPHVWTNAATSADFVIAVDYSRDCQKQVAHIRTRLGSVDKAPVSDLWYVSREIHCQYIIANNRNLAGWAWDEDKGTYYNDELVMDEYFRQHPDLECFRDAPPPQRRLLLEEVYQGTTPEGRFGRIEPSDGTDEAAVAEGSRSPHEQDAREQDEEGGRPSSESRSQSRRRSTAHRRQDSVADEPESKRQRTVEIWWPILANRKSA